LAAEASASTAEPGAVKPGVDLNEPSANAARSTPDSAAASSPDEAGSTQFLIRSTPRTFESMEAIPLCLDDEAVARGYPPSSPNSARWDVSSCASSVAPTPDRRRADSECAAVLLQRWARGMLARGQLYEEARRQWRDYYVVCGKYDEARALGWTGTAPSGSKNGGFVLLERVVTLDLLDSESLDGSSASEVATLSEECRPKRSYENASRDECAVVVQSWVRGFLTRARLYEEARVQWRDYYVRCCKYDEARALGWSGLAGLGRGGRAAAVKKSRAPTPTPPLGLDV